MSLTAIDNKHPSWTPENKIHLDHIEDNYQAMVTEVLLEAACCNCGNEMGEHCWNTFENKFSCPVNK